MQSTKDTSTTTYNFVVKDKPGVEKIISIAIVEDITLRIKYEAMPIFERIIENTINELFMSGVRLIEIGNKYPLIKERLYDKKGNVIRISNLDEVELLNLRSLYLEAVLNELSNGDMRLIATLQEIYDMVVSCIDWREISAEDTKLVRDKELWYYQSPSLIEELLNRCIFRFSRFAKMGSEDEHVVGV